jgi:hypothetical protein
MMQRAWEKWEKGFSEEITNRDNFSRIEFTNKPLRGPNRPNRLSTVFPHTMSGWVLKA